VDVRGNVGVAAGASAGTSLCSLPFRQSSWCGPSAVAAMLSGGCSCRSAFCTEIALWNLGSLDCAQMTLFGQPFFKKADLELDGRGVLLLYGFLLGYFLTLIVSIKIW